MNKEFEVPTEPTPAKLAEDAREAARQAALALHELSTQMPAADRTPEQEAQLRTGAQRVAELRQAAAKAEAAAFDAQEEPVVHVYGPDLVVHAPEEDKRELQGRADTGEFPYDTGVSGSSGRY